MVGYALEIRSLTWEIKPDVGCVQSCNLLQRLAHYQTLCPSSVCGPCVEQVANLTTFNVEPDLPHKAATFQCMAHKHCAPRRVACASDMSRAVGEQPLTGVMLCWWAVLFDKEQASQPGMAHLT